MKSYMRILKYVARFKRYAGFNLLFNLFYAFFNLFSILMVIPFLQIIFDMVKPPEEQPDLSWSIKNFMGLLNYQFAGYVNEHGKFQGLLIVCLMVVVMFLLKNIFRYLALYYLAPLRTGVVRELRQNVFDKIVLLPIAYFSETRKGDIIARMSTDVKEVETSIINTIESTFRDPLTMICFFIAMLVISVELTVFVLILLPIAGFVIGRIGKSLRRKSKREQDQLGLLMSFFEESLSGLRIIKAFNGERYQKTKFMRENKVLERHATSALHRWQLSTPLIEFLSVCVIAALLYYGGSIILKGSGDLTADLFIGYILVFANMLSPARNVANSYFYIQRGIASLERIEVILDAEITIRESLKATHVRSFDREIEYRNVSFNYTDDASVLHNINLKIQKGNMIAIVGPSGSGKSTFADLLVRLHDVTEGQILIDGIDVRDMRISSLRNLMGIVSQESILFNDTVFNNIAFGVDNADEEAVIKAAKVANAHDFIMKLEYGYQTYIGDRGSKLSGGERQRMTIARAIFKNPPVLILDEATSSLDTESEKLVQDALYKLMQNRTSIVIAHRLSTIQFADEIIVMQEGNIVERGNHSTLIAKNGLYAKLVEMQMF